MVGPVLTKWRIACLTFNVNSRKAVANQIYKLFDEEEFSDADFIVVGLQELPHSELFGNTFLDTSWITIISSWMYVNQKSLLYKTSLATNLLLIFAHIENFIAVERIDARLSRSTLGGITGHKGAVSARIKLKNGDGIVFINCHMIPHPENYEKRCSQFESSKVCAFEEELGPTISYPVIWLGDMNWRVDYLNAAQIDERLRKVKKEGEIETIVDKVDQLRKAKKQREAFYDYTERPIFFNPTYRLLVGTRNYDLLRVPSWCDRILYRGPLHCEAYRSNQNITISDHFPVVAFFSYGISSECFTWSVLFEEIPKWSSVVPIFCRFSLLKDFWDYDGAYRDWIGIYPENITDPLAPKTWLYFFSCYKLNENNDLVYVGEFPCLPPGRYRFGYFSIKRSVLQGISTPFSISE